MSFIETIAPEGADDVVAAMYRRQQAAWGYVPNYARAFSLRPEVLARWGQLLAEIRRPMDKHIAATAAGRAFFAKLLDALGVLPDPALHALGESLRDALTVGRPIDEAPVLEARP
jgi:hypothetical protein